MAAYEPKIDGLYLDGVAYDRTTMRRVRAVLERACAGRPACEIDFHSGNTLASPMRKVSPALAIMQHMPYMDSLWLGEGFFWDRDPDYWLAEVSGIPYGLMGETLGGPPELGLVYGMAPRAMNDGTGKHATAIWRLWDAYAIADSTMLGYWDPRCPVAAAAVGRADVAVRATAFVKEGDRLALVAIGVFGGTRFDGRVRLTAPHLEWWSGAAMRVGLGGRRAELLKVGYSNGALDLGVKRGARGIVLLLAEHEAKLAPIARRAGFAVDGVGAFG